MVGDMISSSLPPWRKRWIDLNLDVIKMFPGHILITCLWHRDMEMIFMKEDMVRDPYKQEGGQWRVLQGHLEKHQSQWAGREARGSHV